MTTSTTTAIEHARAIDGAGGLRPVPQSSEISASGLRGFLTNLDQLDINVPDGLVTDLNDARELYTRAANLAAHPEPYRVAELRKDLDGELWAIHVAEVEAARFARNDSAGIRSQLDNELGHKMRGHLPALHKALNTVYVKRAAEMWNNDDWELNGAQKDERTKLGQHIRNAHSWLLERAGGHDVSPQRAEWWLMFNWSREAWHTFRETSLPGYRPRGNPYTFATGCGATPRLETSYHEASRKCCEAESVYR